MNKLAYVAASISLSALLPFSAQSLGGLPEVAVGATGGTAGIGVQLTAQVAPRLNARLQVQGLTYSDTVTDEGIPFKGTLTVLTGGAYIDFYPVLRGWRLSTGLVGNGNKIRARSTCPESCDVGELKIFGDRASIRGNFDFDDIAPYLGFGYANPIGGSPFYVGFDAGVMYHGRPQARLSITGIGTVVDPNNGTRTDVDLGTDPDVQSAILVEQGTISNDIRNYRFYPVVQFNVGWQF